MRKVIILQARLASSRFPGRVLADLSGRPVIAHVIERLRAAKRADDLVVAIPSEAGETPLAEVVEQLGVALTRGSTRDVIGRYIQAAYQTGASVIVRVCADNALVDWHNLDRQLDELEANPELDYVCTVGYPRGVSVETFTLKTLEKLDYLARKDGDMREHPTSYLQHHRGTFVQAHLKAPDELRLPEANLSVNRPEDLRLVQAVYDRLYKDGELIEIGDVIGLLKEQPELLELNQLAVATAA